ncbi:hypothetical protein EYR40_001903 [Pleurotus pulmonarius]|nr:hypothetical protein EYR36_011695 [Pleurotus pulmonarius]KAF4585067.1 hypothetical protein EYR40_001903 [Pleurotus pulmonarius]KAF4607401.1 hypothetical protein EYR38_001472 [Pleurotus pulmonarius]
MSFSRAFSPALRELRILCSQSGQASAGTRQFIISKYPVIKQHNPDLPVLIREATGTPARVFARFEHGLEKHVELDNLSSTEVETKVAQLLS